MLRFAFLFGAWMTAASWACPALGQSGPGGPTNPLAARALPRVLYGDLHEMLPGSRETVIDFGLGDLDGDGDHDVVLGRIVAYYGGSFAGRNGVWWNDGTARLVDARVRLPAPDDYTRAVVLADLLGDGGLDLFVANDDEPNRLLENAGGGRFLDTSSGLPDDAGPTNTAAAGDLDGDADADLVLGEAGQDRLLLNAGGGSFVEATAMLPVDTTTTDSLALGDMDADGDLDLFQAGALRLRFLRNDGSATFSDASALLPADSTSSVQLGDVDGDGDLDVVGTALLLLNAGGSAFTDASSQLGLGCAGRLADVDGDGDLDLLDAVALCENDGAGTFTGTTGRIPPFPGGNAALAVGDLDGDGDADLLLSQVVGDSVRRTLSWNEHLALNDGSGSFYDAEADSKELPPGPAVAGAFGDMDGDGDTDVVTGAPLDEPLGSLEHKAFLYLNDGHGRFADATSLFPLEQTLILTVALGDVDGDGDRDVVLGGVDNDDGGGGGVRLYRNEWPAAFTDASFQVPSHADDPTTKVVLGDVDGDGDLDIAHANEAWPPFPDALYLNDGTGTFSVSTSFSAPLEDSFDVDLADVDGDGDLDLLTAAARMRLYANDGAGVFSDVSERLPADDARSLVLGDVDGDGDLDLFAGRNSDDRLYANDGAGSFVLAPGSPVTPSRTTVAVGLLDVDDDGDLDLLADGALYANDGAGLFRSASSRLPRGFSVLTHGAADVDGDQDEDLLGFGAIWSSLLRHLAWRSVPRIGRELVLDLYGPAETTWVLAGSSGSGALDLGAFGTLFLDPADLELLAGGSLDANGRAVARFAIPADPALVGTTAFVQAAVGAPLRLTNRDALAWKG